MSIKECEDCPFEEKIFPDKKGILNFLKQNVFPVPPLEKEKKDGEKKKHKRENTEHYPLRKLLINLISSNVITYPVTILHEDRPDFILSSNGKLIGIEVTTLIALNLANANKKASKDQVLHISHFTNPVKPMSKKIIDTLLKNPLTAPGWLGNADQLDWKATFQSSISAKRQALNKEGFQHYEENYLLLYDDSGIIFSNQDKKSLAEITLHAHWRHRENAFFDVIYILTESCLIEIKESSSKIYT